MDSPLHSLLSLLRLQNLLSSILLASLVIRNSEAAVATGFGRLNPENSEECVDPDTGLSHRLGEAWDIPGVCGQAHCELRGKQVFIFYAFCGSAQAESPCFLSKTDLSLPYPYCCPRSICPAHSHLDIHTNEINTDDYDDELQMAAASWVESSVVRVAPPAGFSQGSQDSQGKNPQDSQDSQDYLDSQDSQDSQDSIDQEQESQDNTVVVYDTAEDSMGLPPVDEYDSSDDIKIDWNSFISSMPSPTLLAK